MSSFIIPRLARRQADGFTLVEILVSLAVVGILAALALPAFRVYVERAELAQLLVQVDQIATVVRVELADEKRQLQEGARLGKAPPKLQTLTDSVFNEPGGIQLLLIRPPAGFFASSPNRAQYGLVADSSQVSSSSRIHELAHALPFQPGDKVWLSPTQLAFPLVDSGGLPLLDPPNGASQPGTGTQPGSGQSPSGGGGGTTQPTKPQTSWTGTAQDSGSGNWTCQAQVSVMGTDGNALTGSVGVRVRVTTHFEAWDGKPGTRGWDDLANLQNGVGRISLANLNGQSGRGEVITGCQFDVTGVDYYWPTQPTVPWDGDTASITIRKP